MKTFLLSLVCLLALSLPVSAQTRLAAFVVNFDGYQAPPAETMTWMADVMAQVDAFYAEQSYGQFVLDSDVFGLYSVPLGINATRSDVAAASQFAAKAAGVDLSPYTRFLYISPATNFVHAGWGDKQGAWIATFADYPAVPDVRSVSHELGHHLFGLLHAHGIRCVDSAGQHVPTGSAKGSTCTFLDQGDDLDVMGQGHGHFNAVTKRNVGWLAPQVVTATGDYLIAPYESTAGVRSLSITVPKGSTYLVEYRQPLGFDALQYWVLPVNLFNGVVLHRVLNGSELLQMNAVDLVTGLRQPALVVGQSWCEDGRMKLSVLSADSTGVSVRVTLGHCK